MALYPATDKYSADGFVLLDPGEYAIRLTEVVETDDRGKWLIDSKGDQFSLFKFEVRGFPGCTLFERFYFDEEGQYASIRLGKFKQFQEACGISTEQGGDTQELIGRKCAAFVKPNESKGKTYNNIQNYKSLEQAGLINTGTPAGDDNDLPF